MLKYLVSASALGLLLALAPSAPVLAQTGGGSMPTCKANDPVVWLTPRNLYHLKGDVAYGRSPNGRYECLSTAKTQGAARGPVTPMGPGAGGGMMGSWRRHDGSRFRCACPTVAARVQGGRSGGLAYASELLLYKG
jgi:hypothetical protein